jgi:replicative superfamily II helicase
MCPGWCNRTVADVLLQMNVAMLNITTGFDLLDSFKIVYIAPMETLVQEMVRNFTAQLSVFGIKVGQ